MAAAKSRWRTSSGIALLGLVPLLVLIGSPSMADAVTTADGVPQPLHATQVSYGPKAGMDIVGSLHYVLVQGGQLGTVSFGLYLTNKGTVPYDCSVLRAMEIPTKGVSQDLMTKNGAAGNAAHCTDAGHTIAPGSRGFVWVLVSGNSHPAKDIVVRPYGSNVGRMVWTVADCPTLPETCFGPPQKIVQ